MPKQPIVRPYGAPPVPEASQWMPRGVWLWAGVVIVPLVVFLQQFTLSLESVTLERAPRERVESEEVDEPGIGPLTIAAKMAVQMASIAPEENDRAELEAELEDMGAIAVTRVERLRLAIVAGELLGAEEAVKRVTALKEEAASGGTAGGDFSRELDWVLKIYGDGPDSVPAEARESLVDRHGWFGKLALAFGKPRYDRARREAVPRPEGVVGLVVAVGLAAIGGFVGGLVALGVLGARWRAGALEALIDERGSQEVGSERIGLEVFVLFAGGFLFLLGMRLVMFGMAAEGTIGALVFLEVLAWGLAAVLLWPRVRGVEWRQFAADIGLHRGEGVLKEVGCGIVGYLAGVPLLVVVSFIIGVVEEATGGAIGEGGGGGGGYPLFEPPPQNSWALVWAMVLSLVVWAPVLEEIVFRGALFRYLHVRLPWAGGWPTVLITSVVFGLVHPYTTAGLATVASMGVVFGMLRLWRGSLIAPMVAHALHNGFIAAVTVGLIAALD